MRISLGHSSALRLVYLDRDNQLITEHRWHEYSRDPHYGLIRHHTGDGWDCEACWVGVASTREKVKKPFLVQAWKQNNERTLVFLQWCESESEARAVFDSFLKDGKRLAKLWKQK